MPNTQAMQKSSAFAEGARAAQEFFSSTGSVDVRQRSDWPECPHQFNTWMWENWWSGFTLTIGDEVE